MRLPLNFRLLFIVPMFFTACRCDTDKIVRVTPIEECEDESCRPVEPCVASTEVCNGVDDDCDGAVDEELGTIACSHGACGYEIPACADGVPAECVTVDPTAEACNGVDDDCNGAIDDGLMPTSCGVGECQQVVASCIDGVPLTCEPLPAGIETCDRLDNDCDGTVDEDLLSNISTDRRITNNASSSDFVYAAWGGNQFALTWQDGRDGTSKKGEIYFVTLDRNGTRLINDVRVTNTNSITNHPALAWNGTHYGLVYADAADGDLDIFFQRLTATGSLVGSAVRVTSAADASDWPDIVWNGQAFGVTWADSRHGAEEIYFRLLGADGSPLSNEVRVTNDPARQQSPILKWSGTEFAVIWSDLRDDNRELYFRRISATGTPVDQEIRVTNNLGASSWPDMTWNGSGWGLVWQDDQEGDEEIYFARLAADGSRIGLDVRITDESGFSGYPSIDWNGFQYGISWQDARLGATTDIYFAAVSEDGQKNGSDLRVSTGSARSTYTTALWNGTTFGFAWRDDRDGNTEIYFAYVGCP